MLNWREEYFKAFLGMGQLPHAPQLQKRPRSPERPKSHPEMCPQRSRELCLLGMHARAKHSTLALALDPSLFLNDPKESIKRTRLVLKSSSTSGVTLVPFVQGINTMEELTDLRTSINMPFHVVAYLRSPPLCPYVAGMSLTPNFKLLEPSLLKAKLSTDGTGYVPTECKLWFVRSAVPPPYGHDTFPIPGSPQFFQRLVNYCAAFGLTLPSSGGKQTVHPNARPTPEEVVTMTALLRNLARIKKEAGITKELCKHALSTLASSKGLPPQQHWDVYQHVCYYCIATPLWLKYFPTLEEFRRTLHDVDFLCVYMWECWDDRHANMFSALQRVQGALSQGAPVVQRILNAAQERVHEELQSGGNYIRVTRRQSHEVVARMTAPSDVRAWKVYRCLQHCDSKGLCLRCFCLGLEELHITWNCPRFYMTNTMLLKGTGIKEIWSALTIDIDHCGLGIGSGEEVGTIPQREMMSDIPKEEPLVEEEKIWICHLCNEFQTKVSNRMAMFKHLNNGECRGKKQ